MKSKHPKPKPPDPMKAVTWHAQKMAEAFDEFDSAMCRCWKILGSVTMTCEAMRMHAQQLQHNAKPKRKR